MANRYETTGRQSLPRTTRDELASMLADLGEVRDLEPFCLFVGHVLDMAARGLDAYLVLGTNRAGDSFLASAHTPRGTFRAGGPTFWDMSIDCQNALEALETAHKPRPRSEE